MFDTFLGEAERQQYEQIPGEINQFDLMKYFYLGYEDKLLLLEKRRSANRLGLALQIGLLRYLHYLPQKWKDQLSDTLLAFVSDQLDLPPSTFEIYALRPATQTSHLQEAMDYLNYRYWQSDDALWLTTWLLERALEHENERVLLSLACQRLAQEKILRPAIITLERLVVGVLMQLDQATYDRLAPFLLAPLKDQLDALLVVDPKLKCSPHRWLAKPPNANTPAAIRAAISKLIFLKAFQMNHWEMSVLSTNRRKRLVQLARKRTSQAISRYPAAKKYPLPSLGKAFWISPIAS